MGLKGPSRSLPNLAEDLSADAFLTRGVARHHALWRGQNVDSKATQDARNFLASDIYAAARTRNTLNPRNYRQIRRRVLQVEADVLLRALFGQLVVEDVAFFFEDAGQLVLQARGGNIHLRVARQQRVTHSRQHVGNGVCCHLLTFLQHLAFLDRSKRRLLPACFGYAGNLARQGIFTEADAAERKFAQKAARASAVLAAVPKPHLKLWDLQFFSDLCSCCHIRSQSRTTGPKRPVRSPCSFAIFAVVAMNPFLLAERHAHVAQQ